MSRILKHLTIIAAVGLIGNQTHVAVQLFNKTSVVEKQDVFALDVCVLVLLAYLSLKMLLVIRQEVPKEIRGLITFEFLLLSSKYIALKLDYLLALGSGSFGPDHKIYQLVLLFIIILLTGVPFCLSMTQNIKYKAANNS